MRKTVSSFVLMALLSTPALAEQSAPADAPKPVTVTVAFDVLTAYVFRGIHQESAGLVAQPPFDVGLALGKGLTANFGNWYSLHTGPTGNFYEADYYGGLTFTAGKLKPGLLFTSYTSPNDTFKSVHEIAAVLAFDDSASPFPLAPKATLAFELSGQADGGSQKGSYLELGVRPSLPLVGGKYPLNLSVPVRVGLSVKDYYEGPDGSDTFGFFSSGLIASVPVTARRVTWDVHGGVDLLWFGNNMTFLNAGDGFKPVGIIGVTMTY